MQGGVRFPRNRAIQFDRWLSRVSLRCLPVLSILLIACASSAASKNASRATTEESFRSVLPSSSPQQATIRPSPFIAREALEDVLDLGPGAFLAKIRVKPRFAKQQFHGWEITHVTSESLSFARSGLRIGDVVLRINNHSLKTPTHLDNLWRSLRTANSLDILLERAGQENNLRFTIGDEDNM